MGMSPRVDFDKLLSKTNSKKHFRRTIYSSGISAPSDHGGQARSLTLPARDVSLSSLKCYCREDVRLRGQEPREKCYRDLRCRLSASVRLPAQVVTSEMFRGAAGARQLSKNGSNRKNQTTGAARRKPCRKDPSQRYDGTAGLPRRRITADA